MVLQFGAPYSRRAQDLLYVGERLPQRSNALL
jgi:hypothetical protein